VARYLIDSHIFLWARETPARLLASERAALSDASNDIAVSVATIWELSIKLAAGRLKPSEKSKTVPADHFARSVDALGFGLLPIEIQEAEYVRRLPLIHRDPFDRLLIAQALLSNRVVVTRDAVFSRYPNVEVFAP
jgi:PIN domain nuclease of toxin-antitoxin system